MRLLLYLDPSPRREAAIALAGPLIRRPGVSVSLLASEEDLRASPGLLDEAASSLPADPPPSRISRPGPAERAIVEETQTRPYDLLVVPPAGRGGIHRLRKDSRIASLVRRVGGSVLVARGPANSPARVLAAIGGEGMAEVIAGAAAFVSDAYGAEVILLHVRSEVDLPRAGRSIRPSPDEGLPRAHAFLDSLGVASALRRREGFLVEEILAEAEAAPAGLVLLGSPEGSEEERRLRDETTERVLLECPASVLVVRSSFPAPAAGPGSPPRV